MSQLLINQYLADLDRLRMVSGTNRESVVREAFKDLLKAWGKTHDLQFIPEHEYITPTKERRYIDGALLHSLRVPFGYWEAKDTQDDLDAEITKKFRRGYPQTNIIFEDSACAVLIQNGEEVLRCPVDDVEKLHQLLDLFFSYQRPEISGFHKAIEQFKNDLPSVLTALRDRIEEAYAKNTAFEKAAHQFLAQAKETINPMVTDDEVREMLIQHILTEDIFARVFGDGDFHRENNVAKALYNLEQLFFKGNVKQQTLNALEPYYAAIRSTAALIQSHSEKQGFLKAVYENFYKVYNPNAADRLGVVYTPNEIVRFMVESTDWLCEKHFGKSMVEKDVEILDPATGTGTYIVELLEYFRGRPKELADKYQNELHANEVAILPYYVANLNIEASYAAITGEYTEFPNLCFVDTLDNTAGLGVYSGHQHDMFGAISDENVERVKRQNQRKISVIIGNPPYNAWQEDYNQNNANRPYRRVDERIKATYIKEGTAQNQNSVYDMYTRFFRWASDRLKDEGILAFITGRKPFTKAAYNGFRKVIEREFAEIWVVDLGGDVRENPKLSGTTHNVFGIQTGVSIAFLVKKKGKSGALIRYMRRPEMETADDKLAFLSGSSIAQTSFETLQPNKNHDWLDLPDNDWDDLMPVVNPKVKAANTTPQDKVIFRLVSNGLTSQRDGWVYDFQKDALSAKAKHLVNVYEAVRQNPDAENRLTIKWDRELEKYRDRNIQKAFDKQSIITSTFRPFVRKYLYFDRHFNGQTYQLHYIFKAQANPTLAFLGIASSNPFSTLAVNSVFDSGILKRGNGKSQGVPRYRYTKEGARVDNMTDYALDRFAAHYGDKVKISKDGIFAYVYAVLNDPVYGETYAANLKREFPRIPFYANFKRWRDWGQALMDLHIGYEDMEPFAFERTDTTSDEQAKAGQNPRVVLRSDQEAGNITLDSATQLSGIPESAWDYKLATRPAIDWILDQYKEKKIQDPTIREQFNTYAFADHKEDVIALLGRVITVSLKTSEIISAMKREKR